MTVQMILKELNKTLIRYRAGLITLEQCRQGLSILLAMLKAYEDTVMEEKMDRIQAILEEAAPHNYTPTGINYRITVRRYLAYDHHKLQNCNTSR